MPKPRIYEPVSAEPVKSFFVSMLTRDISLSDAILDLLDNCVDGVLRTEGNNNSDKPYKGYHAEIIFNKDTLEIKDNCGGIPWNLHEYAFRMGRKDTDRDRDKGLATVGVYGIGMKRALFKIGKDCLISTQNKNDNYEVEITPSWLKNEEWMIPVNEGSSKMKEDGTEIVIGNLHEGVSKQFSEDKESFQSDFEKKVSSHYAFIIDKGFKVSVNGVNVQPKPTKLVFVDGKKIAKGAPAIRPYIYEAEVDGVNIFIAVGFTRPIPSTDEVIDEQTEKQYSSLDAGWTVVCNDRAVLYCDKSELTGWGEAGVPFYHTQFIAVSGIVEFTSSDASKLPTTTTKRGIDTSSKLYLQVKNRMREGMRIFTDYTNKWKGRAEESKSHTANAPALDLREIKTKARELTMTKVAKGLSGRQYRPSLPVPPSDKDEDDKKTITFKKTDAEIKIVSTYLFGEPDEKPNKVGEKCFDNILKEAKR